MESKATPLDIIIRRYWDAGDLFKDILRKLAAGTEVNLWGASLLITWIKQETKLLTLHPPSHKN